LCSAIITTDPTGTVQPDWIFIQGGQIEITGTGNVQRNVVVYPNTTQQDAYNVSSGDATIATATKSGNTITITGVAVGTTTITVVSTVDPTKTRTLQVVVK
jgi:uncharacterized protein YjdB